jgi:BirA family biotin operon repressor/biotin-[acetyl-CoA-carboxylase] ligase
MRNLKYDILKRLKEAAPGFVSGGELGLLNGVSRTAVWKHIKALRQEGYFIEASPRKGYRLLPSEERLNSFEIADRLGTSLIGRETRYIAKIDSTNEYAKKLAAEGCPDGLAIIAGQQTKGKGRLGRKWFSPADSGIYISFVLRPPVAPAEAQILTLAAAVAVASAIRLSTGIRVGIKWPNDLVIDGKKVCGILMEMSSESDRVNHVVIGVGINYSQDAGEFTEDLSDRAISLKMAVDGRMKDGIVLPSKLALIRAVLKELDNVVKLVLDGSYETILDTWREYSVTLGREVRFVARGMEYTGRASGIAADGRLLVDCDDGVRRELFTGEVSVRGIYDYA